MYAKASFNLGACYEVIVVLLTFLRKESELGKIWRKPKNILKKLRQEEI